MKTLLISLTAINLLLLVSCAQKQAATKPEDNTKTAITTTTETTKKVAAEAKGAAPSGGAVECKSGSDARIIEAVGTENGGCETKYTKNGAAQSVATAMKGMDHCQNTVAKIKTNLTAAGFSCN